MQASARERLGACVQGVWGRVAKALACKGCGTELRPLCVLRQSRVNPECRIVSEFRVRPSSGKRLRWCRHTLESDARGGLICAYCARVHARTSGRARLCADANLTL